jgi:hypothetical protein
MILNILLVLWAWLIYEMEHSKVVDENYEWF